MAERTRLDRELFGPESPCFGCSPRHPIGFRLEFDLVAKDSDRAIETVLVPDERYQGPPGVMHGGLVMALADEIAAWTVIGIVGRFGFTAAASCKLGKPVRIGVPIAGRGTIETSSARIVKVKVALTQNDAHAFQGDFTFALLDEAGAEKLLGEKLPEAWRRFARRNDPT
jgi:acyl-coenzyme A thioesterase PaaI-like protein